jgi:hypothetical protein
LIKILISNPLSEYFLSGRHGCGGFARSGQAFRKPTNEAPIDDAMARIRMPIGGIDHELHDVLLKTVGSKTGRLCTGLTTGASRKMMTRSK